MRAWRFHLILTVIFLMPLQASSAVPQHAQADMFGGWDCEEGYIRKDKRCERLVLPANARPSLLEGGWECRQGYIKVDNSCRQLELPANAQRDPFGQGWQCRRGFFQAGNQCQEVQVPSHGQLNALGNDWECERGFKKDQAACVDMLPDEKVREDQYYRELYVEASKAALEDTGPCRAGYNKCSSSCAGFEKKSVDLLARVDNPLNRCLDACQHGQQACSADKSNNPCRQFPIGCHPYCLDGASLCRDSCQDGGSRCEYQLRQVKSK